MLFPKCIASSVLYLWQLELKPIVVNFMIKHKTLWPQTYFSCCKPLTLATLYLWPFCFSIQLSFHFQSVNRHCVKDPDFYAFIDIKPLQELPESTSISAQKSPHEQFVPSRFYSDMETTYKVFCIRNHLPTCQRTLMLSLYHKKTELSFSYIF